MLIIIMMVMNEWMNEWNTNDNDDNKNIENKKKPLKWKRKWKWKKNNKKFLASKEQGLFRFWQWCLAIIIIIIIIVGSIFSIKWWMGFLCVMCVDVVVHSQTKWKIYEKKNTEKFYDLCILFCCFVLYKIFNSKFFFWKLKFSLSFYYWLIDWLIC